MFLDDFEYRYACNLLKWDSTNILMGYPTIYHSIMKNSFIVVIHR
jgi:hypothetical protein